VCCSVLRRVARVVPCLGCALQCVAAAHTGRMCIAVCYSVLRYAARVLQCLSVRCSVLQPRLTQVHCSVLQCVARMLQCL